MRLGTIDVPNAADYGLAAYAEELGFDSFWVGDNPMMWSDPFVTLALVAQQTKRIRLGLGVTITGLRTVPAVAQGVGTLNLLAPGRVCCGVGTGNSAMRVLAHNPMLQRDYEAWVSALKPLLAGEEARLRWNGRETPVHHLMELERGFFSFDPPPPLYVSGYGPRSLAIAGRHGDGVLGYIGNTEAEIEATWRMIEAGADSVGRPLERADFYACKMGMMCVLRDGEDIESPRIRAQAGPVSMVSVHYAYEQYRSLGTDPPPYMHEFWDEYVASLETVDADRRHLRIDVGHQNWVPDEDQRFVTTALIEGTTMVGTPGQLANRLRALETANVDEIAVTPAPGTAREVLRDIAEMVMPLMVA